MLEPVSPPLFSLPDKPGQQPNAPAPTPIQPPAPPEVAPPVTEPPRSPPPLIDDPPPPTRAGP